MKREIKEMLKEMLKERKEKRCSHDKIIEQTYNCHTVCVTKRYCFDCGKVFFDKCISK